MKIHMSSGTGVGPTQLAAFDHALVNAGVANFNLIYLSSVLPPHSEVIPLVGPQAPVGEWGDRLYVVMAQMRTSERNREAWAGIGWMQETGGNGRGLLVEHEGHTEEEVRADITNSLKALSQNRGMEFGPIHMQVTGKKCIALPVCALAVAVFESAGWEAIKREQHG